jgi:hypothetical protein
VQFTEVGGFIFEAVTARLFEDPRRIAWRGDEG